VSSIAGSVALAGPITAFVPSAAPGTPFKLISHRCELLAQGLPSPYWRLPSTGGIGGLNRSESAIEEFWSPSTITDSHLCERTLGSGWHIPTVAQLRYIVAAKKMDLVTYAMDLRGHLVGFSYHPGAVSTAVDEHETKSRLYCARSADAPSDELPSEDEAKECAELFKQHWLSHAQEPVLDAFLVSLTFRVNQLCLADTRALAGILPEIESRASAERIGAGSQLSALEGLKKRASECISKRGVGPGPPVAR